MNSATCGCAAASRSRTEATVSPATCGSEIERVPTASASEANSSTVIAIPAIVARLSPVAVFCIAVITLLSRALDLLYPPRCVSCAAFRANLCADCAGLLQPAGGPDSCARCNGPREEAKRCHGCLGWRDLDGARAAFFMDGPARPVVHGLKFSGIRDLADGMAEALLPVLEALSPDVVFPVPLHARRQRARGFNQAEVLFERLGWPAAPGRLQRIRSTSSQVGLNAVQRRKNIAGAFRYRGPSLKGAVVAVLDDVVTTGATASECARVLREHGAARVYAIAYARALYRSPASGGADG